MTYRRIPLTPGIENLHCYPEDYPYFRTSMKKGAAIALLFLFLISQSGIAVTMHWCGGKITSVAVFSTGKHRCPCGNRMMKPGCCKDRTTTFKVKNDLAKSHQVAFKTPVVKVQFEVNTRPTHLTSSAFEFFPSAFYHPPPYKPKVQRHLLYQVFLI